jgi:hypothetical protein
MATALGPVEESWRLFLKHAAYVRGHPLFEEAERGGNLELAEAAREILHAADSGTELQPHLESLFTLVSDGGRPYTLIDIPEINWLAGWAANSEASLRAALGSFLNAANGPDERLTQFAQAVNEAQAEGVVWHRPGATMLFGSLFNFATTPELLPVVRVKRFTALAQRLGFRPPSVATIVDRYRSHLAFAHRLQDEVRAAGIPARDMIEVQALIYTVAMAFAQKSLWTEDPPRPPAERDGPGGTSSNRPARKPSAYLAVCSCLGYDADYLIEWLEFHRLVGVERFFLYNNGDRATQRTLLKPYVDDGCVVVYDWPRFPPQVPAYRHCLEAHRNDARWIAFIDTDEFLFAPTGQALPDVLVGYEHWPGVGVNLSNFGPSGHREKPAGLVIESYLERIHSRVIKSITDPARTTDCASPHHFTYERGLAVDENKYPILGGPTTYSSFSRLRINHYYTKSEAEFKVKWTRLRPDTGSARIQSRLEPILSGLARFAQPDREITRYVPGVRESVERARVATIQEGH